MNIIQQQQTSKQKENKNNYTCEMDWIWLISDKVKPSAHRKKNQINAKLK